jgi:uncharacterized protein
VKNILLLHGTDETPNSFWYPWIASEATAAGYNVQIPHLPTLNHEPVEATIAKLHGLYKGRPDILVTHSAGGPLALALLQGGLVAGKTVQVAGFHRELPNDDNPVLLSQYDWTSIAENGGRFTYFNSTNDPWGCNDAQGREMFDQTGGQLIICQDGHFGSQTHGQPYTTFPLLRAVVLGDE